MSVLIIAPDNDPHAICVADTVRKIFKQPCVIWDASELPENTKITYSLTETEDIHFKVSDKEEYSLENFNSIWWRRPSKARISDDVTDDRVRVYCEEETSRFFKGVISTSQQLIINDPDKESKANRKPFQLKMARHLGLKIPQTLMTNDPSAIREFYNKRKSCIYKTFSSPSWQLIETRLLQEEDLDRLDSLSHAPIIVQDYIENRRDIRATVIDSQVFCACPESTTENGAVDWRVDFGIPWRSIDISVSLQKILVKLVRAFGLRYGCIDLREDPKGEVFFLEINPSGQFLFVEVDTGMPVVRAMASLLCNSYV